MPKVKSTIPVYDIHSVANPVHLHEEVVAEPFATYLGTRHHLLSAHRHNFYHIVLFTSGSGTHSIDFEQFPVRSGQIYFMIPGQVHHWNFKGEVDGYIINFSDHLFRSLFVEANYLEQFPFLRAIVKDSVIGLDKETMPEIVRIFEELIVELTDRDRFSNSMVCALLTEMFIRISRTVAAVDKRQAPAHSQLMLYNFKKLVNQHYIEKKLPKDYAAMLYITPNHLNALCSDLLGQSAGEVIRERVLLEAKRMLVNAALSISEIAYNLNFKDNSYFAKFFKKYTGMTAEHFRRSYAGSLIIEHG